MSATQCPFCKGEVGYVEECVGQRVECPHCSSNFIMQHCNVPPVASIPVAEKIPSADLLLQDLIRTQKVTIELLRGMALQLDEANARLKSMSTGTSSINTWVLLIFLLLLALACFGVSVSVKHSP